MIDIETVDRATAPFAHSVFVRAAAVKFCTRHSRFPCPMTSDQRQQFQNTRKPLSPWLKPQRRIDIVAQRLFVRLG
jgi:hypothetical protein